MPDLNYSIEAHRKNLQRIWRSPEWKSANRIFHSLHLDNRCERCGAVGKIVPGHCFEDYLDMSSYVEKVRENRVQALCPRCNRKEAQGKKPCPECLKRGKSTEDIWYITQDQEMCYDCLPMEVKDAIRQRALDRKKVLRQLRDADNTRRRAIYQERKRGIVPA